MDAIFSIHKNFSDLIFSGIKNIEFRNKKIKLIHDDKIYVYETKNGGCGKVVGYFVVDEIKEIPKHKVGTYSMLKLYTDKYGNEEEQKAVDEAMKVHFDDYDDCLVLSYLFNDDIIKCMQQTHTPVDSFQMWQESTIKSREANKQKANSLLDKCDKWLSDIGFYNEYDESTWKYAIFIKKQHKFEVPLQLENFKLLNGNIIKKAPQSYCYVQSLE